MHIGTRTTEGVLLCRKDWLFTTVELRIFQNSRADIPYMHDLCRILLQRYIHGISSHIISCAPGNVT